MPLCSKCRSEADVTTTGHPDPEWLQWLQRKLGGLFQPTQSDEPERCSRCDNCGGR